MLFLHASASVYWLCCLFEVIVNCCNGSFPLFFNYYYYFVAFFWCFFFPCVVIQHQYFKRRLGSLFKSLFFFWFSVFYPRLFVLYNFQCLPSNEWLTDDSKQKREEKPQSQLFVCLESVNNLFFFSSNRILRKYKSGNVFSAGTPCSAHKN